MARYTGPKARINRRLGVMIYESAGAVRASEKREQPPGMHTRGRRPSNYGAGLAEKQKVKYYYGLGERQLRRFYDSIAHKKGNTGQLLLLMCERRLDNVIRRVGFTKTRPQARQGVAHGHFLVNGVKTTSPSFIVRPGDVISVRPRKNLEAVYRSNLGETSPDSLDWVTFDPVTLSATVAGNPGPSDISLPVEANVVVEFLSR